METPMSSSAREFSGDCDGRPAKRQRKKFVACRRCHEHKIKCSGGQPCQKCQQSNCAESCTYFARDRKVAVNESFITQLQDENQSLKRKLDSQSTLSITTSSSPQEQIETSQGNDEDTRNPLIEDQAWFIRNQASAPIYVGEAACAAFATRFRQCLTGKHGAIAHIPRTNFVQDPTLLAASANNIQWPNFTYARLLVKVALNYAAQPYHLVLHKNTLEELDSIYRESRFHDSVSTSKFFALFALGEVYSIHKRPINAVPGALFFSRAANLVQVLPERANVEYLEVLLLLSLYSYSLNRRHSAYSWVGIAFRLSMTLGLHHKLPESQIVDYVARQHRIRIWWTIYLFDRMWGCRLGLPLAIQDDDIEVEMPSDAELDEDAKRFQFSDTKYVIANTRLARIVGDITNKIYSRRKYNETFLQRVQKVLRELRSWLETLPEHLRLNSDDNQSRPRRVTSLHLSFNQCVILATRPILLHVFTKSRQTSPPTEKSTRPQISQTALTLAEACIHAARHSNTLLTQSWINGALTTFGYFDAQYLFSSAVILAIASVSIGNSNDEDGFQNAAQVLKCMGGDGNLSAGDFCLHIEEVKKCIRNYKNFSTVRDDGVAGSSTETMVTLVEDASNPQSEGDSDLVNLAENLTTEMAFLEPFMQEFLAQSEIDLGLSNFAEPLNDLGSLYDWPLHLTQDNI